MTGMGAGETPRHEIEFRGPEAAADAVAILREAAAHFEARGIEVWTQGELHEADFALAARAGELVMGHTDGDVAATMLLQPLDLLYWASAAPNTALYVHKVAVRRAFAGRGWLERLVDFAAAEARARGLPYLRLDTLEGPVLRSLYERLGFVALPGPSIPVRGRRLILMERRL